MKKYKTIALSLLLGFSLAACSDFLEFDPYGLEGSTNFLSLIHISEPTRH